MFSVSRNRDLRGYFAWVHLEAGLWRGEAQHCIWLLYEPRFVQSARSIACVDRDGEAGGGAEWRGQQGCADFVHQQRKERQKRVGIAGQKERNSL